MIVMLLVNSLVKKQEKKSARLQKSIVLSTVFETLTVFSCCAEEKTAAISIPSVQAVPVAHLQIAFWLNQ